MKGIVVGEQVIVNAVDSNFKAVPNIDARYGPYDSIGEALNAIPSNMRSIGVTAGIRNNGEMLEYWFNGGVENINFKEKNKGAKGDPGETPSPQSASDVFF